MDCWQLTATRAELRGGVISGVVDVERPFRGLHALRIDGESLDGWLLAVGVEADGRSDDSADAPWKPADVYTRGADLVATYRKPCAQPFNLQIYWRVVESPGGFRAALDAIVSVQTPLWEAYPCVTLGSALPSSDVLLAPESVVYRTAAGWCYAEVTRPGDFTIAGGSAPADGLRAVEWRFGREFMEKGVIRRLHVRGALLEYGEEGLAAERLRRSLLAEEPPLTV